MTERKRKRGKMLLLLLAAVIAPFVGIAVGSVGVSPGELVGIMEHKLFGMALPERISSVTVSIVWSIRMPRAVMAFLVGASLAASGAVMQSVLRNPLASSYTLGVSSGASLLASMVIVSGFTFPVIGRYTLPFLGFVGGLLMVLGVMVISTQFDRAMENHTVILVGMTLSLFVNAMLTIVTALSSERLAQLVFWQMGSFAGQTWEGCGMVLIVLTAGMLVLMGNVREMDLMTFGEAQALSVGVEFRKVKLILIGIAALMTGTAVSMAGVIGFVDLVAPHMARRIFGSGHRWVVPMSAALGGMLMVIADMIGRTVLSPQELPVGAVTALIGAPFFALIYLRRRREGV